jgi:glutathione S-transferase
MTPALPMHTAACVEGAAPHRYSSVHWCVQVWNAVNRYDVNMSDYPAIDRVYKHCVTLPAFAEAMPEAQPDYAPPVG